MNEMFTGCGKKGEHTRLAGCLGRLAQGLVSNTIVYFREI